MIAIVISKLTNHHLYYIPHYLFSVGIIAYYISTIVFIEINEEALKINFGILTNKQKISIIWKDITDISYVKDPRGWRTKTFGISGDGCGSHRPLNEHCILFSFNNELPAQIQKIIKKYGEKLYYNRFFLRGNGRNLIMLSYPEGGREAFFKVLKKFYENGVTEEFQSSKSKKIVDVLILISSLSLFIVTYFS